MAGMTQKIIVGMTQKELKKPCFHCGSYLLRNKFYGLKQFYAF